MKPVTDPEILRQLGRPVADPAIIAQLEGGEPESSAQGDAPSVFGIPLYNTDSLGSQAKRLGRNVAQVASAGLEGVASLGDIAISPITSLLNRVGVETVPMAQTLASGADALGVPEPANAAERVMEDAGRVVGPALATMGTGGLLSGLSNAGARNVGTALAANPGTQLASAASAGAAGGVARESGAGPLGQFGAALAGGLAVPAAQALASRGQGIAQAITGSADDSVDDLLRQRGISTGNMTLAARDSLRKQVSEAMRVGDVDDAALRRMADYAQVGATPTRGSISLDPAQITRERNLAKIGINSGDARLQQLGQLQRQNDLKLTEALNRLGADTGDDAVAAGKRIISALKAADEPRKQAVDMAYKAVRDSQGRYANLDVPAFSRLANDALDEGQLGYFLPKEARNILNDISAGKTPFNVNTAQQLDSTLSGLSHDMFRQGNSRAATAVNAVRGALHKAPIDSSAGADAMRLYKDASRLAAERFSWIERNPALKAALDDMAPDKFVQTFITGSGSKANVRDVAALANDLSKSPEAFQQARTQIAQFLKSKALGGADDELGNFSPSAYRRAINSIGDRKLGMFFNKDEVRQLRAIGRVATYEKFQPTGSAVNNSNTAGAAIGRLLDVIPFGRVALADPARSFAQNRAAKQALSPSLLSPQSRQGVTRDLVPYSVYASGLLGQGTNE